MLLVGSAGLMPLDPVWQLLLSQIFNLLTWRLHSGILGDHSGDPGIHRDSSCNTTVVKTWISSSCIAFWTPLGSHFGTAWAQIYDLGCENGSWY